MSDANALRSLPSVDEALRDPRGEALAERHGRAAALRAVREAIASERARLMAGEGAARLGALLDEAARIAALSERPALRRAVNATGVVLHTGLGRAVLSLEARAQVEEVARGYSLLEVDVETGERGVREAACAALLCALTGAEAATVVNNNAAATLLMLAALARGKDVVVARGQLVEIGGSFRIPEVMEESGARLREVGATNKVRLEDYERAIGPETAAILRVHPSNFRVVGFTGEVPLEELARLARARGVLLLDDLGSGCLVDLAARGLPPEPPLSASIAAGADVVCASGDKLLGAPQCGIALGREAAIARMRRHPLFRAVRPDKLCLAGLEATLRVYRRGEGEAARRIPGLRMLFALPEEVRGRAEALAARLQGTAGLVARAVPSEAQPGSGALPVVAIPSYAVSLDGRPALTADALARRLRAGDPSVFPRIAKDEVLLDLRTILPGEEEDVERAVRAALGS